MPDITVPIPTVNLVAYFTFKEPFNLLIKNKFNIHTTRIRLKVVSIISMRDTIRNDLRDPYSDLYQLANIPEVDYKADLLDNISIVSFSYIGIDKVERFIRVPINYIEAVSDFSTVDYVNKSIVVDMNRLPFDLDLSVFFNELSDFIETRYGIEPVIQEVSIGEVELVDTDEHVIRETVRANTITVHKTLHTQLEEITLKYNELVNRLNTIGISLS